MRTEAEAVHFLRSAQIATGKKCIMKLVRTPGGPKKYRIFPDEEAYEDYLYRLNSAGNGKVEKTIR